MVRKDLEEAEHQGGGQQATQRQGGSATVAAHAVEGKFGREAKGTCGGCITEEEFGASNDFGFDVHSDSCTAPTAR